MIEEEAKPRALRGACRSSRSAKRSTGDRPQTSCSCLACFVDVGGHRGARPAPGDEPQPWPTARTTSSRRARSRVKRSCASTSAAGSGAARRPSRTPGQKCRASTRSGRSTPARWRASSPSARSSSSSRGCIAALIHLPYDLSIVSASSHRGRRREGGRPHRRRGRGRTSTSRRARSALHPALPPEATRRTRRRSARRLTSRLQGEAVVTIESGGLVVRALGVTGRNARGYITAAGTGTPRGTELRKVFNVGQEIDAKVVEIDPRRGEVKLSIKALSEDQERSADHWQCTPPAAQGRGPLHLRRSAREEAPEVARAAFAPSRRGSPSRAPA